MPVEVNTGARLRTAYLHDDVNETLIRKAPFYIYEALKPLYNLLLPTGPAAALAFKTPIECCKARQAVEWRFTIAHAGEVRDLRFVVEQFPCRVPPASEHTHQYVNWISYANIAKWHNAPIGTPAYEAMLRKYLRAAVFSRQNILPIPLGSLFEREAGQPVLRTERLIRLIRLGEEVGLRLFEGSAFCSRSAGQADDDAFFRSLDMDAMHSPDEVAAAFRKAAFAAFDYGTGAKVSLTGEAVGTPAARETLASMAKQLFAFLQEHDLVSRWTQCLMDEPNDALAAAYREIAQTVKPLMPGVKILEPGATHPRARWRGGHLVPLHRCVRARPRVLRWPRGSGRRVIRLHLPHPGWQLHEPHAGYAAPAPGAAVLDAGSVSQCAGILALGPEPVSRGCESL